MNCRFCGEGIDNTGGDVDRWSIGDPALPASYQCSENPMTEGEHEPSMATPLDRSTCCYCGKAISHGGTPALADSPTWFGQDNDFMCPDGEHDHRARDLDLDLRSRWLPSDQQILRANVLLKAGYGKERNEDRERGVYTAHLLINKTYGLWSNDVELVFLDGLFLTRDAVLTFVNAVARQRYEEGGQSVVGGWAWHFGASKAAVWEDIASCFPHT